MRTLLVCFRVNEAAHSEQIDSPEPRNERKPGHAAHITLNGGRMF